MEVMLRSTSLLLAFLGLSLATSTIACSGADAKNDDVDTSKLAVQQQKDGKPTGDGQTCSWGGRVAPPVSPVEPPRGGSSGGCDGNGNCWSYDASGQPTPIEPSPGSTSGWSGSSTSSSGGSSGGCSTDEKGNTHCWSYPPEPSPEPTPMPEPAPVSDTYKLGDWFPALDGCNRCTCTDIGIMCTVQVCEAPPPPPPSKGCELDGKWFAAGDSVPTADTCNSCGCGPDGQIACTMRACAEEPPPAPKPTKPAPPKQ